MKSIKQRFWEKVKKTKTCWLWTAHKVDGYGSINCKGKMIKAHRFSWQLAYGNIPKNLCILHKCDVRACVNPKHLFIGTQIDNNIDMVKKGRAARGEKHNSVKLTKSQVLDIRSRSIYWGSQPLLAKEFKVSQMLISYIINRKIWKHI